MADLYDICLKDRSYKCLLGFRALPWPERVPCLKCVVLHGSKVNIFNCVNEGIPKIWVESLLNTDCSVFHLSVKAVLSSSVLNLSHLLLDGRASREMILLCGGVVIYVWSCYSVIYFHLIINSGADDNKAFSSFCG